MLSRRFGMMLVSIGILLGIATSSQAALLAAPDHIPSDAVAVISIPDSPAMWSNFQKTPLHASLKKLFALPAIQTDPDFQSFTADLKEMEAQLGYSLSPDAFLTQTLAGMDLAVRLRSGMTQEPDLLVTLRFKDPKNAAKLLQQIETEAKKEAAAGDSSTTGTETTESSQAVIKQTIAGQEVLVIPAQGLWVLQKNDLLLLTSSADYMNKALTTSAATAFDKSAPVREGLAALGNPTDAHVLWFVDYAAFLNSMAGANPMLGAQMKPLEDMLGNANYLGVLNVAPESIQGKAYVPNPGTDPFVTEMAAKYPPTSIQIGSLVPGTSMLAVTANNFDGTAYFNKFVETIGQMAGAQGQQAAFNAQVEQWVAQFEAMMGFKLREDLLPALGPETAFSLENFAFSLGAPSLDMTLDFQIKDKEKLDLVLQKLETFLTTKLPAMLGPGMSGQPAPTLTMQDVTFENSKGRILVLPQMPSMAIGWITAGDYIVFGTSQTALKNAATAAAGKLPSMKASPSYKRAAAYLPEKANSEFMLGIGTVAGIITNMISMFQPQAVQGDNGAVFLAAMDAFKTIETTYLKSLVKPDGSTLSSAVLLFTQSAPAP